MTQQLDDTLPYPWPYDGDLDPARMALVVAGAQGWWAGRSVGGPATVETVAGLADRLRSIGVVVVVIRHARPTSVVAERSHLPGRGTSAWEVVVDVAPGDLVVDATGLDGFCGSTLDLELRAAGRDHLVICGLGLEGPVHSTLRRANDIGYECLTLTDLSAPLESATRGPALSSITMSGGIFGAIGSAASLEAALRARTTTPSPAIQEKT